jgi:hypothetical protein
MKSFKFFVAIVACTSILFAQSGSGMGGSGSSGSGSQGSGMGGSGTTGSGSQGSGMGGSGMSDTGAGMNQGQPGSMENEMMMHGKVTSVDTMSNMLVIKTEGKEDTLMVGPGAVIMTGKSGQTGTLGSIKKGKKVTVHYKMMNGQRTVTKIMEGDGAKSSSGSKKSKQ